MISVSSFYSAENAKKQRTPVYRVKFGSTYRQQVLNDSPDFYYRFGEASGSTATDESPNALAGTYHGTVVYGVNGGIVRDPNTAVLLDGSTGYISSTGSSLAKPGDTGTWEVWVKPLSFASANGLFDQGSNCVEIYIDTNGLVNFNKYGVGNIAKSTITLTLGQWNYVVVTKAGSSVHIYVNGIDVTGAVSNASLNSSSSSFNIGKDAGGGGGAYFLNGMIDEAAVYNSALSAARVAAHYVAAVINLTQEYSTNPIKTNYPDEVLLDGACGYWRFGESSGSSAADKTGNGFAGTYHASPTLGVAGALTNDNTTSVTLNGSTQYVSTPNVPLLHPGDTFSLEMWVNITGLGNTCPLFYAGSGDYELYINTSRRVTLAKIGTGDIVSATTNLLSGWHHIVATKSGSSVHLYIDGVDVTGVISNQTIVAASSAINIGTDNTTHYTAGTFQEAAIYGQVLSADRVQAHYDAAYMRFNRTGVSRLIQLIPAPMSGTNNLVKARRGGGQSGPTWRPSQVIPERSQSSTGNLNFTLVDTASYVSEILSDAPAGFWRLNDLFGGYANDSGVLTLTGLWTGKPAYLGNPVPSDFPSWGASLSGSQYATLPNNTSLHPGTSFSIEAFVKLSNNSGTYPILDSGASGDYTLFVYTDGQVYLAVKGTGNVVTTSALSLNAWHHVLVVNNNSAYKIYVDGVDVTVPIATTAMAAGSASPTIGYDGANYYSGGIACVSFYGYALAIDRIRAHYQASQARTPGFNGEVTLAVGIGLEQSIVTFSAGFDLIRETDYISLSAGILDSYKLSQDLSGYDFVIRDPATLANKQIFTPASSYLTADLSNSETTSMSVNDVSAYLNSGYVIVDSEIISYASKTAVGTPIGQHTWTDVVWNGSIFVAVSSDGFYATSSDGQTWTTGSMPEANAFQGVEWSSDLGLFVAVASTGTHRVYSSTDGSTWTARDATGLSHMDVAWSHDLTLFVIVGGSGDVMTSANGTSWTQRAISGFTGDWKGVCWSSAKTLFVAVGGNVQEEVMTSPDGINWTNRSIGYHHNAVTSEYFGGYYAYKGPTWRRTATDGSQIVSIFMHDATGGKNLVATSTDGTTWTPRAAAEANRWTAICWSGSLFCAVAADGTHRVMTSSDGITWTARTAAEANEWVDVCWNGSIFCAVASIGSGTHWIMTSSDGITWTARTIGSTNFNPRIAWSSALGLFAVVGANCIYTSPDGITWTSRTVPTGFYYCNDIVWSSTLGLFVAVGQSLSGYAALMTSSNGTAWTVRSVPIGSGPLVSVIWDSTNSVFVAGYDSEYTITSTDGITWSAHFITNISLSPSLVSFGGKIWFTTPYGTQYYSTDGANWTQTVKGTYGNDNGNGLSDVVWSAALGMFCLVGSKFNGVGTIVGAGHISTSTDGISWTSRAVYPATGHCVIYDSTLSLFIVVDYQAVFTSPDGITWTARTPAGLYFWTAVANSTTAVTAIASSGTSRSMKSTDGISWIVSQQTLNTLVRGLLGTSAVAHSTNAIVKEMIRLIGHPIDIINGVLTNQDKTGVSMPSSLIDSTTLAAIKAATPTWYMDFRLIKAENAKNFLEQQLYQPCGFYPVQHNGKLSVHQILALSTYVDTITEDNIVKDAQDNPMVGWDRNFKVSLYNKMTFYYDHDVIADQYNSSKTDAVTGAQSIIANGASEIVINSLGIRTANAALDLINAVCYNVISRYANGAALVMLKTLLAKNLLEGGDCIAVTSRFLPNHFNQSRGVVGSLMEVTTRGWNLDQGTVDLIFQWPNW